MQTKRKLISIVSSTVVSTLLVALAVYAATTIGDDITVGDDLTLTGDTINLPNGETIDNATDGTIKFTSDAGTITGTNAGIDLAYTGTLSSGEYMIGMKSAVTTAGTAGTGAIGVYGTVTQGETKNVNGYLAGGEFEVVNSNTNPSDWFPLVLDINSAANG
jgi:carbonic anhydrase/acetyltransferase-like protein (isoleucine patch superfamily)